MMIKGQGAEDEAKSTGSVRVVQNDSVTLNWLVSFLLYM